MISFIDTVKNLLFEQNKNIQCLFSDNIISKNTFYKYRNRYPSLKTVIDIANYLQVSMDYIFELSQQNTFECNYQYNADTFYNNLMTLIKGKGISSRSFCRELNFSKDNILRWKNGIMPSVLNLIDIANYFNCLIDDLLL